jgi:hypothetical protein
MQTSSAANRDDVGVPWPRRVCAKTRRVFSFLALSARHGAPVVWKGIKWWMGFVMAWGIITIVGVALKADILVILVAIVVATVMTFASGSFRVWDQLDMEVNRLRAAEATLFNDYDAFFLRAQVRQPRQIRMFDLFKKNQVVQAQNDYNASLQEWWRETIGEYHDHFRLRVMTALKGTPNAEIASDPKGFDDLRVIRLTLQDLDPATQPEPAPLVPDPAPPSTEKGS